MTRSFTQLSVLACALCVTVFTVLSRTEVEAQDSLNGLLIEPGYRHLGDSDISDWEGVSKSPESQSLEFYFTAEVNHTRSTLRIRHRDVTTSWRFSVNDRELGKLRKITEEGDYYYEVPAGVLIDGENSFKLMPEDPADDIAVGHIRLINKSLRDFLELRRVKIKVVDETTGDPLPVRVSITGEENERPEIFYPTPAHAAVRNGLIYLNGAAEIEIRKGKYQFTVTRGMEWSRAVKSVEPGPDLTELKFSLKREVDTSGYVSADTHIHTLTFSNHGDASVEERVLSLAGEGIEFAIATDHNHNTDYRPHQEHLKLNEFFTPVVGNEVSTDNGHFSAFPLNADDEIPRHEESDWVKLVDDMRSKGAKVVILNHPRWPYELNGPFGVLGLNRGSGDRDSGTMFTFDGMELVNSTTDAKDPLYLFDDWFSLLNRGEKIVAVGVSDSHTIGDPVGQGRTYIKSSTDDAAKLNVDELCENIVAGRSSVSLGIFVETLFDKQFGPGELVKIENNQFRMDLHVRAPGWIHPTKAMVFVNGVMKAEQGVPAALGEATDAKLTFQIPIFGVDAHVVCVVLGDPVEDPSWKTFNDYTLAATNPVYLDVNGDGKYRNPRESAQKILTSLGGDKNALINTLEIIDPVLGVQLVSLVDADLTDKEKAIVLSLIEFRAAQSPVFKRYLDHVQDNSADH